MLVTELLRKVVVFIGHKGIDANKGMADDFVPNGTGFILLVEAHDFAFPFVVTAKHVIDDATGAEGTRSIFIRINTKGGGADYIETKLERWGTHPDHREGRRQKYIDVATYLTENYRDWGRTNLQRYDFSYLMEEDVCTDETIKKYSIGIGDEVVIPGLFLSHIGTNRNIPVVRTGNIAAMREEPLPTSHGPVDDYLVETRSIAGISGSPALTHMAVRPDVLLPQSETATKIIKAEKTHFLLGLVQGYYTLTTQDEWVFKTETFVGHLNTGITVVVPAAKIMETIFGSPVFKEDFEMARKFREDENTGSRHVDAWVSSNSSAPE